MNRLEFDAGISAAIAERIHSVLSIEFDAYCGLGVERNTEIDYTAYNFDKRLALCVVYSL